MEAPGQRASNSDDNNRFNAQCCCTRPRQTWFNAPSCSGVYYVTDISSLVLIVITHSIVDIWR